MITLSPLPREAVLRRATGKVIVIENNRDGQLASLLGLSLRVNKFDGRPITPKEVVMGVRGLLK